MNARNRDTTSKIWTAIWLEHAAEVWAKTGPTGRWASVVSGKVVDYDGNVLFSGPATDCVEDQSGWRIPTRLVPTSWVPVSGEIAGCDYLWQLVFEPESQEISPNPVTLIV